MSLVLDVHLLQDDSSDKALEDYGIFDGCTLKPDQAKSCLIVLPRFGETTNSKIHEKTAVEISKIVTISTLASFKMYDMISAEHRKDLDVCKLELMYMRVFEKLSERKALNSKSRRFCVYEHD